MARRISQTIDIAAPRGVVWQVLTDFEAYPSWNPFIVNLDGDLDVGGRLTARIQPPGRRPMTFRPVVRQASPGATLRWLGHLIVRGLFDGEHAFELAPLPSGGTRFTQSESFSGILVPLLGRVLTATEDGFRAMNEALKVRAEGRV